jgi:excinuclease UvrABC ATPase subunit
LRTLRSWTRELRRSLKGVLRAEFVPFFRRLAEEGLWDEAARWGSLDAEQRGMVSHGYWIRPGHGTFIKKGRDTDGSEVNHWLRWDGLVAAVESQLARSSDATWRDAVTLSRRRVSCPSCLGAGLGTVAELVLIEKQSLRAWEREGQLGDFLAALRRMPTPRRRTDLTRQRVIACLEPLFSADPPLRNEVSEVAALRVAERVVRAFVGLSLVIG